MLCILVLRPCKYLLHIIHSVVDVFVVVVCSADTSFTKAGSHVILIAARIVELKVLLNCKNQIKNLNI